MKRGQMIKAGLSFAAVCTTAAVTAISAPAVLEVGGEPFFPIGWYDSRKFGSAAGAAAAYASSRLEGMNTILLCYYGYNTNHTSNALAGAAANGMRLMVEVNRSAVKELSGYPLSLIDEQVNHAKVHPALLGWYLIDEPELHGVTPAMAQARYAQIKSLDPDHAIFVVRYSYGPNGGPLGRRPAEDYLSAEPPPYTDVLMTDTYMVATNTPVLGGSLWFVTKEALHSAQLAETNDKCYINVVQAHSHDGTFGVRSPTFEEQRYLSYAPIVTGARGLLYWMHYYTSAEYRSNVVGRIVHEIRQLVPAIVSGSDAVAVTSTRDTDSTGHGIEDMSYLFGEDSTGGYLIAANNTASSFPVVFELSGDILRYLSGAQSIPVLFEERDVLLEPHSSGLPSLWMLSDTFSAFAVHVYRLYAGPWSVPFEDDFEERDPGDIQGQNGWMVSVDNAAIVQTNVTLNESSTNACRIGNTNMASPDLSVTLSHNFSDPVGTNMMWIDFCAWLVSAAVRSTPTNASVLWYVNKDRKIVAYDGTNAKVLSAGPAVNSNEWSRFVIRSDYSERKWDLWMNATSMLWGFSFYDTNQSSFSGFNIIQGGKNNTAYLDNVSIDIQAPGLSYEDEDGDGMADPWEIEHFGSTNHPMGAATADWDGDGFINLYEYGADTIPTNDLSLLEIIGIHHEGSGVMIEWKGGTQAWQYLEYHTNLTSTTAQWTAIFTNEPITPITNSVLDLGATNEVLLYRIKAER